MKHILALTALLLLNALVKFSLWTQPPQTFTDSLSYLAPAISLLDGRGYGSQESGYRAPVYPLFIAAILLPFDRHDLSRCREPRVPACLGDIQSEPNADSNLRAIVFAQIILGVLTIPLVYFFAWSVAKNSWVAALCALTYPLDLSTGYWEISILTEALATFLLALAVALTLSAAHAREWTRLEQVEANSNEASPFATRRRGLVAHQLEAEEFSKARISSLRVGTLVHALLGLTLAALALCQPIYLLYMILPAAFLVISSGVNPKQFFRLPPSALRQTALVLVIPIFFVLAWCARNYFADGFFTPSTLSGYNLTQMVGPFMELAPEPYRDLAEIYVDTRNERQPIRGTHSGTIFFAYREMLAARQTTWAGLSRDLMDLSIQLILKNPLGYLHVASESFDQFWKFGLGRQNLGVPVSYAWVSWFFDSRVQQTLTFLFWLTPFGLLPLALASKRSAGVARGAKRETIWVWFAIATVWYVALFSSALNFGDNERYRVPVARLQYSAIILTAWMLIHRQAAKNAKK